MSAAMFEPRPEIRIATRLRSRMVAGGPILGRVPGPRLAAHGAAPPAFFDPTDFEHFLFGTEGDDDTVCKLRIDDHRHTNTAIERPGHFLRIDPPAVLKPGEDDRQLPT